MELLTLSSPSDAPGPGAPKAGPATPPGDPVLSRDPASVAAVAGATTGMVSVVTLVPGVILLGAAARGGAGADGALLAIGLVLIGLAGAGVVAGVGLLRLKFWAWPTAMVVCALQVLTGLLRFALQEPFAGPLLAVCMGGFALYYLFRLEVRAAFERD